MERMIKTYIVLGLLSVFPLLGHALDRNACETAVETDWEIASWSVDRDEEARDYSLRDFVGQFNRSDVKLQNCKNSITLKHDVQLRYPLIIKGQSGGANHLVIDGAGHTLTADEKFSGGECMVVIRGNADNVTIKNLRIKGGGVNAKTKLDGLCLETERNVVSNVTVLKTGGYGIKVDNINNYIQDHTLVASAGKEAVYVSSKANAIGAAERVFMSQDTVVAVANRELATGDERQAAAPIRVEADTTKYVVSYSNEDDVRTLDGWVYLPTALNGTTKGMKILVYKAVSDGSKYTEDDSVSNADGKATAELLLATVAATPTDKDTGEVDATSDRAHFTVDISATSSNDQIYLRIVPFVEESQIKIGEVTGTGTAVTQTVTADVLLSSSSVINLGGAFSSNNGESFVYVYQSGKGQICDKSTFNDDNKCVTPGQVAGAETATDGDGSATGTNETILGGGSAAVAPGPVTKATWNSAISSAVASVNAKIQACKNNNEFYGNPVKLASQQDAGLIDDDGDGIPNVVEDPEGLCAPARFDVDSDDDGLTDSEEDRDSVGTHNGYVDCVVKQFGKPDLRVYPVFLGKNSKLTGTKKDCDLKVDVATGEPVAGDCKAVKANTLGAATASMLIPRSKSFAPGTRKPKLDLVNYPAYAGYGTTLFCSETDPAQRDTDGDGISDGKELQRKYVDRTANATYYTGPSIAELIPVLDDAGNPIDCRAKLASAERAVIWGLVMLPGQKKGKEQLTVYACKSDAIEASDSDLTGLVPSGKSAMCTKSNANDITCTANPYGRTDPRVADTDLDGRNDGDNNELNCPTDPRQECKRQCFYGWRKSQIQDIAGIAFDTTDAKAVYESTYKSIADAFAVAFPMTPTACKDKRAVLEKLGVRNLADEDAIPDLVESGLSALGAPFNDSQDCSAEVFAYVKVSGNQSPSAFTTWTDKARFGDELTAAKGNLPKIDDVEAKYDDDSDPCPGQLDKTVCTDNQPQAQIDFRSLTVPAIGCYIDRDGDSLAAISEDLDGDGKRSACNAKANTGGVGCETSDLLTDTNDDGITDDFAVANGLDPIFTTDTDKDGLSDAVEIGYAEQNGREGTPGVYESHLAEKLTCGEAVPPGAEGNYSKFDTNPNKADTDEDGINDKQEILIGTNPNNPDSDNDGLCDGAIDVELKDENGAVLVGCRAGEDFYGNGETPQAEDSTTWNVALTSGGFELSDPCSNNTDGDIFKDADDNCKTTALEYCVVPGTRGTDTDQDGLDDKTEKSLGLDPNDDDTDRDGLKDGCVLDDITGTQERGELCNMMASHKLTRSFNQFHTCGSTPYAKCDTNPFNVDTDGDGLTDGFERDLSTNPRLPDTDGDCIPDGKEAATIRIHPDGSVDPLIPDGVFTACTMQVNPVTGVAGQVCTELNPNDPDTDDDNLCDGLCGGIGEDLDGSCDGVPGRLAVAPGALLANPGAFAQFSEPSPLNWDTDGDGISDDQEMFANGSFNRLNFSLATTGARQGCSLVNDGAATPAQSTGVALMAGVAGLALAIFRRRAA